MIGRYVERARRRGKRVTKVEAEAAVRASNYWSKLGRRSKLLALQADYDSAMHGFEYEPEPHEIAASEIKPPRHTLDVESVLRWFWDDNPKAASDGDWYHLDTLLDWLEEQAHEVELPNV